MSQRKIKYRGLTYLLITVWLVLMSIGVVTLIDPDWLNFLSSQEREDNVLGLNESGRSYLEDGFYAVSARQFKLALDMDSTSADSKLGLGEAYLNLNMRDSAIVYLRECLEGEPLLPHRAHLALGNIYEASGYLDSAKVHYLAAAKTATEPTGSYYFLGRMFLNLQMPDSAEKYLRLAWKNQGSMRTQYIGALRFGESFHRERPEEIAVIESTLENGVSNEDLSRYDKWSFQVSRLYSREAAAVQHLLGLSLIFQDKREEGLSFLRNAAHILPEDTQIRRDLEYFSIPTQSAK